MISFSLKCDNGHRFDSWFASGAAFDVLAKAGHLSCIDCGSTVVRKALMAPAVALERGPQAKSMDDAEHRSSEATPPAPATKPTAPQISSQPSSQVSPLSMAAGMPSLRALAALRKHVEATADYVGRDFAKEVRAIDDGSKPERALWGEVSGDEARALIEEGLPVAPLPFGPRKKSN